MRLLYFEFSAKKLTIFWMIFAMFVWLQKMFGLTFVLLISSYVAASSAQCLTGNDSPAMVKPDAKDLLTSARLGFSLDALRKASLIEPDDNLFFSPHSLHQAITLAYFGARGTTESSLKTALHIPEELTKVDLQRSYSLEKLLNHQKKEQVRKMQKRHK